MLRGMNKKGQEGGANASTVVGFVLLAVLLVLIVLLVSGFFNPLLESIGLIPGSGVSALVAACDGYVQLSSSADYCTFREVKHDGRTRWVNCEYVPVQTDMKGENKNVLSCNDADRFKKECSLLLRAGKTNVYVNDKQCGTGDLVLSCGATELLPGDQKTAAGECASPKTRVIKGSEYGANEQQVCCVEPIRLD